MKLGEINLDDLLVDYSVNVDPQKGAATVSVPIPLSEGREKIGPALSLVYQSPRNTSPYGEGWNLGGLPAIGINTQKQLPTYRSDEDAYVYAGQELTPYRELKNGMWREVEEQREGGWRVKRYRAKREQMFERIERWIRTSDDRVHWVVLGRGGEVSVFGRSEDDSTRIADPNRPQRTFQWLLETQYHPKGNAIEYKYKAEDDQPRGSSLTVRSQSAGEYAQRYLKRIRYGNTRPLEFGKPSPENNEWLFEVVFDYGEHAGDDGHPRYTEQQTWPVRQDPFSTYQAGFEIRTRRLCRQILMFHHFDELGSDPCLISATELSHRQNPAGATLSGITQRGFRKDLETGKSSSRAMPSLQFEYHQSSVGQSFQAAPHSASTNVPNGLDGILYRWVDLQEEGLPGILSEQSGSWYFKENLGDGEFGRLREVDEIPARMAAEFELLDFNRDGNLDFVGFSGREAGFYERDRRNGEWKGLENFSRLPRIDFANARVQFADLNGDGNVDFLVERQDRFEWYASDGEEGFKAPVEIRKKSARRGGIPTMSAGLLNFFFADMTGDGLPDMVRAGNGRVEYWPNMGYGEFGDGVVMHQSPRVASEGEFDPDRVRFTDVDGSGTADLLYIGRGEVRYWLNENGNQFSQTHRIRGLPYIDDAASVQVLDFLGDGTSCLVWSSILPDAKGQPIRYLPLGDSTPRGTLIAVDNSAGRRTELHYRSSAEDYLRDKAGERPWRSKIPGHVLVVSRIKEIDKIGGGQRTRRWEYHDGFYEEEEQQLVGFGWVDQYDAERGGDADDAYTPPSLVRTWYHTGETNHFAERAADFYQGDPDHFRLPPPVLHNPSEVENGEYKDAYHSLAGLVWRQEEYAVDAAGNPAATPLRTTELAYRVRRVHPEADRDDASFTLRQTERLVHHYEGKATDPRIHHNLLLERDSYGNETQQVSIAYPRRQNAPDVQAQQRQLQADLLTSDFVNIDTSERYEVGIETQNRRYQLLNLSTPAEGALNLEEIAVHVKTALSQTIDIGEELTGSEVRARLSEWRRTIFWKEDQTAELPAGQTGNPSLLHHIERTVFPSGYPAQIYGNRVDNQTLRGEAGYSEKDGYWWASDTVYHYRGKAAFYRLAKEVHPEGRLRHVSFDEPYWLFSIASEDGFGNRRESVPDYQALAAQKIIDANDNIMEVGYDPLGVPFAHSEHGKRLGRDGQPHPVGDKPLAVYDRPDDLTFDKIVQDPSQLLQTATKAVYHNLRAWNGDSNGPTLPYLIEVRRDRHINDGEGNQNSDPEIQVTIQFLDGFGRTLQSKRRADPGEAVQLADDGSAILDENGEPQTAHSEQRWWTSGDTVYNNKGSPVRHYEPFFSPRAQFDSALRQHGVSTRIHYDPFGRVVRRMRPEGTAERTEYASWSRTEYDANDTIVGTRYETERRNLPQDDPERKALKEAKKHADTPTVNQLDSLGRVFRTREVTLQGSDRIVRTEFDDQGQPKKLIDALARTAFQYAYDMLGQIMHISSIDSGEQWYLFDAAGQLIKQWDGRDVVVHRTFDRNGRLTRIRASDGARLNNVVVRTEYGDEGGISDAKLKNVRGRTIRRYDEAGVIEYERYDSEGGILANVRRIREEYKETVDWANPTAVELRNTTHRTETAFDALGRPIQKRLPDGTTREFTYSLLDDAREVRVSTEDGAFQRKTFVVDTEYNARGQRERIRYGNNVEVDQSFDEETFRLNRLRARAVNGSARTYMDLSYTYDPNGNIVQWLDRVQEASNPMPLIEGATVTSACTFEYDDFGRLAKASGRVHQAMLPHDYRRGAPGFKGTRHISLNNAQAVERYNRYYTYDLAGNLEQIQHTGGTHPWTRKIWTSDSSNRSLPGQHPDGANVSDPESYFDANGNYVRLPHLRQMERNWNNRLKRAVVVSRPNGEDDAQYNIYGEDGRRVRRIEETRRNERMEIKESLYLEGCEIHRVRAENETTLERTTSHISDGSATVADLHQWSIDKHGREINNVNKKKVHYKIDNHLGSVAIELNDAAQVISYEEYFPFGGTAFIAGKKRDVKLKEYRYSGKLRDDMTGLYDFGYRFYAPFIGKWLRPDPLGPRDGLNLYRYVYNNPVKFKDPNGLQTKEYGAVPLPDRISDYIRQNPNSTLRELNSYVQEQGTLVAQYKGRSFFVSGGEVKLEQGSPVYHPKRIERAPSPEQLGAEVEQALKEGGVLGDSEAGEEGTDESRPGSTAQPDTEMKDESERAEEEGGSEGQEGESGKDRSFSGTDSGSEEGGEKPTQDEGEAQEEQEGKDSGKVLPADEDKKGTSSGSSRNGAEDVPPVPVDAPTGPEGIPYDPDLPEEAWEGRKQTDSLEKALETPDPRGEPGSAQGSSFGMSDEGITNPTEAEKMQQVLRLLEFDFEKREGGERGGSIYGRKGNEFSNGGPWIDLAYFVISEFAGKIWDALKHAGKGIRRSLRKSDGPDEFSFDPKNRFDPSSVQADEAIQLEEERLKKLEKQTENWDWVASDKELYEAHKAARERMQRKKWSTYRPKVGEEAMSRGRDLSGKHIHHFKKKSEHPEYVVDPENLYVPTVEGSGHNAHKTFHKEVQDITTYTETAPYMDSDVVRDIFNSWSQRRSPHELRRGLESEIDDVDNWIDIQLRSLETWHK